MTKIVQSFWAKPMLSDDNTKSPVDKLKGGWIDNTSHLMSWGLSCLQLSRYYKSVELVTDDFGKYLLIDKLQLPYTNVRLDLNGIYIYHHDLWAIGKIIAYKIQHEPFIHVDSDVYIFEKFNNRLSRSQLVCQNFDLNLIDYKEIMDLVEKYLCFIPEVITHNRQNQENLIAANAGIMGGNDLDFFAEYTDIAIDFINRNLSFLHKLPIPNLNIVFEQYLFYCLAASKKAKINTFYKTPDSGGAPDRCVQFLNTPHTNKYIHLIASYKKNIRYVRLMQEMLRKEHPEMYFKVLGLKTF